MSFPKIFPNIRQMLPGIGGNHKYKIIPSKSKASIKYLNLVVDLNRILCVCQEKKPILRRQVYMDGSRPNFNIVPYLTGSKTVFICPSCQRFLRELSNVADITIWISMRVTTTKSICDLFLKNFPQKPINILG
jgi:hypothetical protein